MLHEFVTGHREEIIRRCRAKVKARATPPPTPAELDYGIPLFLDQLVNALRHRAGSHSEMDRSAAQHGRERQLQGFTVSQVVHDYGDVCQSITDLALEVGAPIGVDDFRTLNRCLDDAIASAVTEYERELEPPRLGEEAFREDERFEFLAHEIRNLVNTASIAFEVLDTGDVGVRGSTGRVLKRSLTGLRDLINRSMAEVRLRRSIHHRTHIVLSDLVGDLAPAARLEADARGLSLTVQPVDAGVAVHADRQILTAVVVNLLQNAFKFTRPNSHVVLRAQSTDGRVLIEVEDECGGMKAGAEELIFRSFQQRGVDRTGVGLGLPLSRKGIQSSGGNLSVRNIPGRGCVFTIDLPQRS
jgi:signal transduction histidine kinase